MVDVHSGLRKPKFIIPGTKCEAYCRHSFWVAEAYILHSHNDVQSLGSTFILGCGNVCFKFLERGAKPRVDIHSGLRKPRFSIPGTRCEAYGPHSFEVLSLCVTFSLGRRNLCFPFLGRVAKPMVDTHPGLQKLTFSIPRQLMLECRNRGAGHWVPALGAVRSALGSRQDMR
jgi:hypothetical protein